MAEPTISLRYAMRTRAGRWVAALTAAVPVLLLSSEVGLQTPPRSTGGNFSGEGSCADAGCHTGAVNPGRGSISVTIGGKPLSQYRYMPGEAVTVKVRVAEAGKKKFGFQITARDEAGCVQAGVFTGRENEVWVQRSSATPEGCAGSTVEFPTHWEAVAADGEAIFEFQWTAPPQAQGPIRWAAAGVAGDGDGTPAGDSVYTVEAATEAASNVSVQPAINEGGVVLATGTPVVNRLVPNAIATVYGKDFAPEGTSILQPELDENNRVQDKVFNTCVTVNGKWSPLYAILPGQINFQVPHDTGLGTAEVRVIRGCNTEQEQASNPVNVTVVDAAPAFFNFANSLDGNNPIAALRQIGSQYSILAPEGMFAGGGPAAPGDIAHLYATGLGQTNPALETGAIPQNEVPNGQAEVVNRAGVRIRVGGVDVPAADIYYVGAAPCCAGLYQVSFKVPETLPDGNHKVVLTVNGVSSPEGPYIAVKRR